MRKKTPNLQIDGGEAMLLVKVGNDGFKSRVRTLMPGPIQFRDQLNFVGKLQLFCLFVTEEILCSITAVSDQGS